MFTYSSIHKFIDLCVHTFMHPYIYIFINMHVGMHTYLFLYTIYICVEGVSRKTDMNWKEFWRRLGEFCDCVGFFFACSLIPSHHL